MRILFLSHYFPPEVNAPASRTYEHARRWVASGHDVTVVTNHPHHPHGRLFPGYQNRWLTRESLSGIKVRRVWSYLAPNAGVARRLLNYLAFVPLALWRALQGPRPEVVVATSPQFFCALTGWLAAALWRRPFVFELRDLWPESVAQVGAIRPGLLLRAVEKLELFLYRRAALVVSVTDSFKANLVARGIAPEKIAVIKNGVDLKFFSPRPRPQELAQSLGLSDKTVIGYIGTLGLAHDLDTVLDAARLMSGHKDIYFIIVGDGARRAHLKKRAAQLGLGNLSILPMVAKADVPQWYALCDICLVTLADKPLFETVLPSKVFEVMAMERPLVYTVPGECRRLVEESGSGSFSPPGTPRALALALSSLARLPKVRRSMAQKGRAFVEQRFDRRRLAGRYLKLLTKVVASSRGGV